MTAIGFVMLLWSAFTLWVLGHLNPFGFSEKLNAASVAIAAVLILGLLLTSVGLFLWLWDHLP